MSTAAAQPTLDMDKLNAFMGQFVGDLGAAVHAGLVVIGEKLGLYKALAEGPLTTNSRPEPRPTNVTCASGWPHKPPVATSRTMRRRRNSV
jgi:hypothetical protein